MGALSEARLLGAEQGWHADEAEEAPYVGVGMQTINALRRHAGQLAVLHLATHSNLDSVEFLRSQINFHGEVTLLGPPARPTRNSISPGCGSAASTVVPGRG